VPDPGGKVPPFFIIMHEAYLICPSFSNPYMCRCLCDIVCVVQVLDSFNSTVDSQLNPVFQGDIMYEDQFQLVFVATLPALGQAHYLVTTGTEQMVKADVKYINLSAPSRYGCCFFWGGGGGIAFLGGGMRIQT
jgi:hypothetical protein